MAQVHLAGLGVARRIGQEERGGAFLVTTLGDDARERGIDLAGLRGEQHAVARFELFHPAVGRRVELRMTDDVRRFADRRIVGVDDRREVGVRYGDFRAIDGHVCAGTENLDCRKGGGIRHAASVVTRAQTVLGPRSQAS